MTVSVRQRILEPDALRALPRGQALLLATGCRAELITLNPWYTATDAQRITTGTTTAETTIARRAGRIEQEPT